MAQKYPELFVQVILTELVYIDFIAFGGPNDSKSLGEC